MRRQLPYLLLLCALGSSTSWAFGDNQYLEETATLEGIYETRARGLLNTFLRPNDYTIVVSAEINQDEQKLDEYREDLEIRYLPGLPLPTDPNLMPANNKLHELKSRLVVHLVLNTDVSADKEALLRSVLESKLHLSADAGDELHISRSTLTAGRQPASPDVLPELSWKMWALIVLMALLALAGLVYWANRRKHKKEEEEAFPPPSEFNKPLSDESSQGDAADDGLIEEKLRRTVAQIMAFATEYPSICSDALVAYFASGKEQEVTLLCETMGWETAKKVFPNVPARVWGKMGSLIRDREEMPELEAYLTAITDAYRFILSRVLEDGTYGDDKNPFQFVFDLPPLEREQLLAGESVSNLSLLSLYASDDQIQEILEPLKEDQQGEFILETARLNGLPESAIRASVRSLSEKLKTVKENRQIKTNGPEMAANFMRSMDPQREIELFDRMLSEFPEEADKIRRVRVQFVDILKYPESVLRQALEKLDVDLMVNSLTGAGEDMRDHILGLMPPKKVRMILGDLELKNVARSPKEVARARRQICQEVELALKEQNLDLPTIWSEIEKSA